MSPRIGQFDMEMTDAELDALITIPVQQVVLCGDATVDANVIGDALRAMFIPDHQSRAILRSIIASALAHCKHHMDTDEKYLKGLYSKLPWGTSRTPAICFTGPAGSGKSQILLALGRIFFGAGTLDIGGHTFPLVPHWAMTLAKGDGLNQLLKENVEPKSTVQAEQDPMTPQAEKEWQTAALLKAAAKVSWRSATCIATIDEFQWIASSSTANAKAATVLLKLHGIGPLLIYCANFSLIHKLKRRPPEDRDRLLLSPIVLNPLRSDDPDWVTFLEETRNAAPDLLAFDPSADKKTIHQYTYGIKRKVVDLIVIAVHKARSKSKVTLVGNNELHDAYRSAEYAMHREDVEAMMRQDITGKIEREDLSCPFVETSPATSNVLPADAAINSFEQRAQDSIAAAAMLPSELAAHEEIANDAAPKLKAGKVVRFRAQKVTKDSLLAGAAALDALD